MGNKYAVTAITASLLLASANLWADINNDIVLGIEEPSEGSVMTGVSNLRGWAVAPVKVDHVEWFLNGEAKGIIPYGGDREDVGQQFPQFVNSGLSGFSSTLNYSLLSAEAHTLRIRVVDVNGDHQESTVTFNVTAFKSPFIKGENGVSITDADISKQGETILLNNVNAEGNNYNIALKWNQATQSFDPTEIALIVDNDNQEPVVIPNKAPEPLDDVATVSQDSTDNSIDVLLNDTDPEDNPLTIASVTEPDNGGAAVINDGKINYTPASGFSGLERFSYTVNDGNNGESTASVSMTVEAEVVPNQAPKAADDAITLTQDSSNNSIDVLANDTDPEENTLTIASVTNPDHGTAIIEDGKISYTPTSGFSGSDQFSYTIKDGDEGEATGKVTITVELTTSAIPDVKGQWASQTTLASGNCSFLEEISAEYNLTDQDGENFSGTVSSLGETTDISGQLNADGDFTSSSNISISLAPGCIIATETEGNFLSETVDTRITGLSNACPALLDVCANAVYSGSISRN